MIPGPAPHRAGKNRIDLDVGEGRADPRSGRPWQRPGWARGDHAAIPPRNVEVAGGLWSTTHDQLRYARFHLGDEAPTQTARASLRRIHSDLGGRRRWRSPVSLRWRWGGMGLRQFAPPADGDKTDRLAEQEIEVRRKRHRERWRGLKLDAFCHWGCWFKVQATGGARWPGFMLLFVIDAEIVT